MSDNRGRLIQKIKRTPSVESFRFKLPEKWDFIPGQFTQVIFDEANRANKDLNKYLSFSCSPDRDYVEVTKRLSSSYFSRRLDGLKIDDEVLLRSPSGNCVYKPEYSKIGFLIGGIGITPVISIIDYIVSRRLDTDIVLVYSNRTDDDIAFKQEIDSWIKQHNKLKVHYLVTDCEPKDKTCMRGMITKDLVKDKICDLTERMFYIFGPPRMVDAMQAMSFELGCSRENIKTESFFGY